jgi:hypothetical protein
MTTVMQMDLILDIKTIIASYDREVWYRLYRYDPEFRAYAMTPHAIARFIELFTVKTVYPDLTEYRLFGKLHRRDLPAMVCRNGDQYWYWRGSCHRDDDLPAAIHANGTQWWYQHGQRHRGNDLPAIIGTGGYRAWHQHGVYVRHES